MTPRLGALLGVVERLVREPGAEARLAADNAGFLREAGLEPRDVDATAAFDARRLLVYRRLVRGGITAAIRVQMPRTAARLGGAFEELVGAYVEARSPRSHYLRDVPFEFLEFAAPRLVEPAFPGYLGDLARHELSEYEAGSAPDGAAQPGPRGELSLELGALFHGSARLHRYAYAVHELPESVDERAPPREAETWLFVHRDAAHEVRYVSLTPLAGQIVRRLLDGATLRAAIEGACADSGCALDDAVLAGVGAVLTDLAVRGALLGPREGAGS